MNIHMYVHRRWESNSLRLLFKNLQRHWKVYKVEKLKRFKDYMLHAIQELDTSLGTVSGNFVRLIRSVVSNDNQRW